MRACNNLPFPSPIACSLACVIYIYVCARCLPPSPRPSYGDQTGIFLRALASRHLTTHTREAVTAAAVVAGVWDAGKAVPAQWAAGLAGVKSHSTLQTAEPAAFPGGPNIERTAQLVASADGTSVTRSVYEHAPRKAVRVCGLPTCAAHLACETTLVCSRCKRTYYCGPVCQRAAWSEHKLECRSMVLAAIK